MQITSQHRLEWLFRRISYADTIRYIQGFKTKQICFQDIFYNLDHILCSHTCCEWVLYIKDFNNEHIALFYLPIFPSQSISKIFELLYKDIEYNPKLGAIPASYDIKYIKNFLSLMNNTNLQNNNSQSKIT